MTHEYILLKSLCRPAHCYRAHIPGQGYVNDGSLVETKADYDRQRRHEAESQIENMGYAPDYAEPGHDAPKRGVLFANWNVFARNVDTVLERAGYAVEWSDEWTTCDDCGKAVRTSPDSYGWKRSYFHTDDGVTCVQCVREDPSSYLEYLEGDPERAETMDVDLAAHGYTLIAKDFEHGWHPGQNDSPRVVAKSLQDRGVSRFIFKIDDVGQFDVRFSVYVHQDEIALITDQPVASALPYEPGVEMGKALRGEPSDVYRTETRMVTPDEFVSGSWLKDK